MLNLTRPTAAAHLVQLVTIVLLSINVFGQDVAIPQIEEIVVGCREQPSRRSAILLEIGNAWVQDNGLFADLLVTNRSKSTIRLPRRNVGGNYWDAVLRNSKNEPITYCGGVSEINLDPQSELVTENDIVSLEPGGTTTLPAVYLAPFWPYLREADYDVHSFEVNYIGWSSVTVHVSRAELHTLTPVIEQATKRQCSLYGSVLSSRLRPFTP